MKTIELTSEEREAIVIALGMRCNWIETDNIHLSAKDVQERLSCSSTLFKERYKINALSESQMKVILLMKELIRKLYA